MKVIFLDLDGVLNSERSFLAAAPIDPMEPSYHEYLTQRTIDPVAVGLLNRLALQLDARIVISSTHRKHFERSADPLAEMQAYFGQLGVDAARIIGATPSLHKERGHEIQHWLDRQPWVTDYVILDDSTDMLLSQLDHFVRVDGLVGLTAANYYQASSILGGAAE